MFVFHTWKTSTVITVLQAIFGGIMYVTTGNVRDVIMVVTAVAMAADVIITELGLGDWITRRTGTIASITAIAVYVAMLIRNGDPVFFGCAVLAAVLLPAVFARLLFAWQGVPISRAEFAAMLPLGLGTVLGGAVLLWKKFCAQRR